MSFHQEYFSKRTYEFEKLKSSLIAGEHKQYRAEYEDNSSPTVSSQAVFMISALAAAEGRTVAAVDIIGENLNSDMPDSYVLTI